MNRRIILIVALFMVSLLVGWIYFQNQAKTKAKSQLKAGLQNLPEFEFAAIPGMSKFDNGLLALDKPLLLVYFNSECEHCQYEVQEICRNADGFQNKQVVLVSSEDEEAIHKFSEEYELSAYPFIKVAKTEAEQFYKTFGTTSTPSVFIYNKDRKLVKDFKGEVKIETLLKYLSE